MPRQRVELYFDFVSPYSYLALMQAEAFGRRHGVEWDLRPVVYGVLLDRTGLVGPAEVDVKRRYTMLDIARSAAILGVPMVGPPAHPFRSLEALRTVCLFRDEPAALQLTVALARAAWGEGRDLESVGVIAEVVAEVGLGGEGPGAGAEDGDDPGAGRDGPGSGVEDVAERLAADEVKERLRQLTEEALAAGVFGVPTFRLDGELYWGHDRMPHLALRLDGTAPALPGRVERMLARPRAADRRGAPGRGDDDS